MDINRKSQNKQIYLAVIILIILAAIFGFEKQQQAEIDNENAGAKVTLRARKSELKRISNNQNKEIAINDPTAKANTKFLSEIKDISGNAKACFKLLYTVSPEESKAQYNIRKENWQRYVTPEAAAETGHTGSVEAAKKYHERITHVTTDVSVSEKQNNVYKGVICENSIQTSNNFKGTRNQEDWYLFTYDNAQRKFTKLTLLGFNYDNE